MVHIEDRTPNVQITSKKDGETKREKSHAGGVAISCRDNDIGLSVTRYFCPGVIDSSITDTFGLKLAIIDYFIF